MLSTTRGVGAFASAAITVAILSAAQLSGAQAQETELTEASAAADEQATEDAAPEIRFVSNEVVQELPEVSAAPEANAASLRELVETLPDNGALSPELMCLAQAVYFESRGEPLAGQLAVARVVINRAESSLFPDDYCSVVTQRAQFSFVRGGAIPQPNTASAAWQRANAIARIAHRDLWHSEADDALYFHATHVRPRWAGRMTTRARIDNHIFYR